MPLMKVENISILKPRIRVKLPSGPDPTAGTVWSRGLCDLSPLISTHAWHAQLPTRHELHC
jgi:hypothetical protein